MKRETTRTSCGPCKEGGMTARYDFEEARQSLLSFRLGTVAVLLALMVAAILAQRFYI